jgi:N-6 DNA Methylase
MPTTLSKDLRKLLASVTQDAREAATQAARAALENLAVHEKDFRRHMTMEQRQLRNRLRARGRALGDERDDRTGAQSIDHLAEDIAYEHWHRLLFTSFLTENHLLHTDESHGSVPVTLEDCEELASEEGVADGFELASRFASLTLPGVFRPNDPVLELALAKNDQVELRRLLNMLPPEVFTSDDALGWTYQFWQATRKDEVNASGKKIGADELPAVTQLFTEDYMVKFLLHNTLGAWWAGKKGPIDATTEVEARARVALPLREGLGIDWAYLRLVQDEDTKKWQPAAGTFDGWPGAAKAVTFLDPCMGSGHFPAFALPILARLRMEEESLPASRAVAAVLRDNLYGLELDPRCAQIGAFNIALTAWKLAGYQALPSLQVACSGLAPNSREADWLAIAGGDDRLRLGMERLHRLFQNAPVLGSLIDPRAGDGDLLDASFQLLRPLLEKALSQGAEDHSKQEMMVTASGLASAAAKLTRTFSLVATNVPYLARGRQNALLQDYCKRHYPAAKAELATSFIQRAIDFCDAGGSVAVVTPQSVMTQVTYKTFRRELLQNHEVNQVARLGSGAFDSIGGEIVNVILMAITRRPPQDGHVIATLDVSGQGGVEEKQSALRSEDTGAVRQRQQLLNPDAGISLESRTVQTRLAEYAGCYQGLSTGDDGRWRRQFWDVEPSLAGWRVLQTPSRNRGLWAGREDVVSEALLEGRNHTGAIRGHEAWGKRGVAIDRVGSLARAFYDGQLFHSVVPVVVPLNESDLSIVVAFCLSDDFVAAARVANAGLSVDNGYLSKLPFDYDYWKRVAAEKLPNGFPHPQSSDVTQWLFSGHPGEATNVLHAAVPRLLGYCWPRQVGHGFGECKAVGNDEGARHADADGIVCLAALGREQPAAARLRALLAAMSGRFDEHALIRKSGNGAGSRGFEEWLRDEFFEQHCDLFHHRPFIWHVWDGRRDGFHALVNSHRFGHANLKKLTYNYLGDWIRRQEEEIKANAAGADLRLAAARELQQKLVAILEGKPPFDIFVRWKPMSQQAIGWEPDLNDGVRLNIRPFVEAGVLRKRVQIRWEKDRGKEPLRDKEEFPWFWCDTEPDVDPKPGRRFVGHRWNNVHLTLATKRAARGKA